jgi:glycosyltransferase involved in cell wall biosynthesis
MVSVVITTYNRRVFLKEAVLSVLNQDYKNKEVIVIDDGSTDNSHDETRGLPVQYIWTANEGISHARNTGIQVAKGEYIAFLDVDDLWLKGKLSQQIGLMEGQGFSISYTDEIWIRNGKRLNQRKRHKKYTGYIFEQCLPLCIISPSSVVIKREIFDDVGLFDESLPVCEDYDIWLRIASKYPVLFVDKPLIVKRGGHEDQLSIRYEGIDRFRIQSLLKIVNSGTLDNAQYTQAKEELIKKCQIYGNGAKKRGKVEEAGHYFELIKHLKQENRQES